MPQGLCVVYATLIWSSREAEVGLMFVGQMACEALNWGLKRLIKEERPRRTFGIRSAPNPSAYSTPCSRHHSTPSLHAQRDAS